VKGEQYIPILIERLQRIKPDKVILFGSYAYGTASEDSDLDILFVTGDETIPTSYSEKSQLYLYVSKTISDIKEKFPVDLIVHTRGMHNKFIEMNSLFAREILNNGKILYEKDHSGLAS